MYEFSVTLIILISAYYSSCENEPSIIIVGAGPAGFAAASRLLENGLSNVKILEAEGRIGGRINSVEFGDAVVDLGAQWVPGDDKNIVSILVKKYDLIEPADLSSSYVYSSYGNIDENLGKELYALCKRIYYEETPDTEVSTGDYIISRYNETIREIFGTDEGKLKFAWDILNAFKGEVLFGEGAFSWFDSSAISSYMEEESEHEAMGWKGRGYKTILDVLMKSYFEPNKTLPVTDKILFNKEVTQIVWDDNSAQSRKVTVKCLDNSEYIADHVIITVSLGVLKDRYETLFRPPLPQEKINAIEELGIGAVAKVYLHFAERWWLNDSLAQVQLCWLEDDRFHLIQEFPKGPNDNNRSWLESLVRFLPSEKNPNVLCAWFTGEFVPQIELMSDDAIVDGVMFALRKFMGHRFNVTEPDAVLRYNWYTNPHFRGTYSFETLASRRRETPASVALSKPLASNGKEKLLFAGEATSLCCYSTVHGAIQSGYREADRLVNLTLSLVSL